VRGGCAEGWTDGERQARTYSMQAHVGTPHLPLIAPCRARLCHQNTTADKIDTKVHAGGAGWNASGDPKSARRCTVRQAATTTRTRGNCSVQPTFPYAPMTCLAIQSHEFGWSRNVRITCTKWQIA